MRTKLLAFWLAVIAITVFTKNRANAELVLYEGFNYGSTDAALNAVSGIALGLDGSSYTTGGTVSYLATGLTFGDLAVDGGAARLSYHASELRTATRGLNLSVTSGTLYGSYLYRNFGAANNGVSDLLLTSSSSHSDTQAKLNLAANEYDSPAAAQGYAGIRSYGQAAKATGTQMDQIGTNVYMVLFEVTNMGATSGSQTINQWVLNSAQFANFKMGGVTSAELNAASTGSAAEQVMQVATLTLTGPNYMTLNNTDFLRLFSYRGNGNFDEIRLATSGLDEVTPVPEPAAASLLVIGAALAFRRKRA